MYANVSRALLLAGLVGGCGNTPGDVEQPDLTQTFPDGFVQTGCSGSTDCDDSNPCTVDTCVAATKICAHVAKDCAASADACNSGVCNVTSGACEAEAANENMSCVDMNGAPGACKTGVCTALPTCEVAHFPSCGDKVNDNTGSTGHTNALDTYACGTGFVGNEVALNFQPSTTGKVTVKLTSTTDLDLLILEGDSCNSGAVCTGQSVTVGTGNESVTFNGDSTKTYTIVVESKGAAIKGAFSIDIACAKLCETAGKTLACNQTIVGNTSTSLNSNATITKCTIDAGITAGDVGPEDSWQLSVSQDTDFKIKLTGLTQDLDIQAIYSSSDKDCDGFCKQTSGGVTPGFNTGTTSEEITFSAFSGSTYYVLVDSRTAPGGAYQMEVTCPINCSHNTTEISCGTPAISDDNDGSSSDTQIDAWACSTGTTGPETM